MEFILHEHGTPTRADWIYRVPNLSDVLILVRERRLTPNKRIGDEIMAYDHQAMLISLDYKPIQGPYGPIITNRRTHTIPVEVVRADELDIAKILEERRVSMCDLVLQARKTLEALTSEIPPDTETPALDEDLGHFEDGNGTNR